MREKDGCEKSAFNLLKLKLILFLSKTHHNLYSQLIQIEQALDIQNVTMKGMQSKSKLILN